MKLNNINQYGGPIPLNTGLWSRSIGMRMPRYKAIISQKFEELGNWSRNFQVYLNKRGIKEPSPEDIQLCEETGLLWFTSQRQYANGTREFYDPIAKCSYTYNTNGQTYRRINGEWSNSSNGYPINPRRKTTGRGFMHAKFMIDPLPLSECRELIKKRKNSYWSYAFLFFKHLPK